MYEYKAKLDRVIDGDTVDLFIDLGFGIWTKQRIRMFGINTPESRTRDLEEKKRGLAAKKRVREFLKMGPLTLRTQKGDSKGKYGRILGIIVCTPKDSDKYSDELIINEEMIKEGHAVEYFGGKR